MNRMGDGFLTERPSENGFQTAFQVISCAYLPGTTSMRCFSEVFACLNNEA